MSENLETIPTSELIEKAKRTSLEKLILRLSLATSLLLIVASWIGIFWQVTSELIPGIFLCFYASIMVPLCVGTAIKFVAEFRGRKFIRELNRRYGRWSIRAYIKYYKERLSSDEKVCIFKGRKLPHGGSYWGYFKIKKDGSMSVARAVSRGLYYGGWSDPWCGTELEDKELSDKEKMQLSNLIQKTKGTGNSQIDTKVRDGFPVSFATMYGDESKPTIIQSNLAGLTEEQRQDDRVKLLQIVTEIICDYSPRFSAFKSSF